MLFQESDIESYLFHENGLSGGKPIHAMFHEMSGGSAHGLGGLSKDLGIPVGLIIEESSSKQCIRSQKTGNNWICKTDVGYMSNDAIDNLLHLCTFKTPAGGLFFSANATLPSAFQMRKGVKNVEINRVPNERPKKSGTRKRKHAKQ